MIRRRCSKTWGLALLLLAPGASGGEIPQEVPPRRASQMADGFGINIALPREPRMPWTKCWTPLFDSGVKWVRIGQYENSSEKTGWDWVELTPGRFAVHRDVDEAIRSLRDNGVAIEVQLQYSNPLYGADPAARPKRIEPAPPGIGPGGDPVPPIFLPPKTDEQVKAFLRYVRFMVGRYRGAVSHWELWNEENKIFWQPRTTTKAGRVENARWYGKVLARVAAAIRETDPRAGVIFGGLSGPDAVFAEAALQECGSAIDVMAYHPYVRIRFNHPPEEVDAMFDAAGFRERVLRAPGVRRDLEFWVNEWNAPPSAKGSNESVQARYMARFLVWSHALGMRPFPWIFIPGTDGNEGDRFGLIHGENGGPDAFRPRPALKAFETANALFGQTAVDRMAEYEMEAPAPYDHGQLRSYAFRDRVSVRPIYAWWLAVVSDPADRFEAVNVTLTVRDPGIARPVLIDVRTGAVRPLEWTGRAKGAARRAPRGPARA